MDDIRNVFNDALENEKRSHAVVRKQGSQWCVFSKKGKNLGCFPTKKKAQERLRQIEFFKNKDEK